MSVAWGSMGKLKNPWVIIIAVIALLYFLSKQQRTVDKQSAPNTADPNFDVNAYIS